MRDDGTVKVLDFGLAKALDPSPDGDPSQSPTLTAAATQMGVIMGTAAYMSPEQARGKPVDKRADIWAFGVVLLEMLTGRTVFEGEDVSMTLSSVLQREPDWRHLPSAVSPSLSVFLHRCLEKEPKQRVGDIHDVRLAMEGAFETAATPVESVPSPAASGLATPRGGRWHCRRRRSRHGPRRLNHDASRTRSSRPTWCSLPLSHPTRPLSSFDLESGSGDLS